jgi:signal peptidase I
MTATSTPTRTGDDLVRRIARAVLTVAVRGRRERGGPWGEAVLGEFDHAAGTWEAVRWAAGGLRAVWQERRGRVRDRPRYVRVSLRLVGYGLTVLVAATLLNRFVISSYYIPSGGMQPTMQVADRWLVDKVSFRVTGLRHDDIVAVHWPGHEGEPVWAKRIIGLPGDSISCRDGQVFRNGTAVSGPYLPADPEAAFTECTPVTVPSESLYLLGDHRVVSYGSQQLGTVPVGAVKGRFLLRYWPFDSGRAAVD